MKRLAFLVVFALGAGCGDPSTVEDVYQRAIDLECEGAHECRDSYPGSDAEFVLAYADTVEACLDRLTTATARQVQEISTSVEEGRIAFDPGAAGECLDELERRTCQMLWTEEDPAVCAEAFRGLVEDGGDCDIDLDCATPGSICAGDVCIVPD